MKKFIFSKKLLSMLFTVVMVLTVLGVSFQSVSASSEASPWKYSSTPKRAIYYKNPVMKGNDVKWVQQALNITVNTKLTIDGSFGPASKNAVIAFQKKYSLSQDGSFGPASLKKMISVLESKGYKDPADSQNSSTKYNLIWPTENKSITGKYGKNGSKRSSGTRYHSGIDIGAAVGDNVYSIADGKVILSGYTKARGYYLVVYHEKLKISSLYEHLKTIKVSKGNNIKAGQVIALSGKSGGYNYPPHLHYGIIKGKANSVNDDLWYVKTPSKNKTIDPDARYNKDIKYKYK